MAQKPKEQEEKNTTKEEKPEEKKGEKKRGFLAMTIRENIQDIVLAILVALRLKSPTQTTSTGATIPAEKQTPSWILSAFPSLTRDDENEYNLALDSHPKPEARIAAEEFWEAIKKDKRYDEVRYIVNIVELRREFTERLKHPAPKDESGGRLSFESITLRDSVNIFFDRLLEEKNKGGSLEEIYRRQEVIALNRKLLPKKHLLKRLSENKASAIMYFFATLLFVSGFMYFILYWIFG